MKRISFVLFLSLAQPVLAVTGANSFDCLAKAGQQLLAKTEFRDLQVETMYLNKRTFKTGIVNFLDWLPDPVAGRPAGAVYYGELHLRDANNHTFQLQGYLRGIEKLGAYNRETGQQEKPFDCYFDSGFNGPAELKNDQGRVIATFRY